MTFRDSVVSAIGANPEDSDAAVLTLLLRSLRKPSEVSCPTCGWSAVRNGPNKAGGHRYKCEGCERSFIHGGPGRGKALSAENAAELLRLVDGGSSIRGACKLVGVAPATGRKAVKRVANTRHAEIMKGNHHADGNEPYLRG